MTWTATGWWAPATTSDSPGCACRSFAADLVSERSELVKSMSSLQKKYFVGSGVGKSIYSDQIASYEERLAEIESEIEMLKISGGPGK